MLVSFGTELILDVSRYEGAYERLGARYEVEANGGKLFLIFPITECAGEPILEGKNVGTPTWSIPYFLSLCSLVVKDHDPRMKGLCVDQLQRHPLLEVFEERHSAA